MSEEQILNFSELGVQMGQSLEILPRAEGVKTFSDCIILGMIPDQSLILSVPESGMFPDVQEGQDVVIRVFMDQGVALFNSTILYISDVPLYMVYLDFPSEIKFKRVRKAARVDVTLPVLASNPSNGASGIAGKFIDISAGGAGLELYEDLGEVDDDVIIRGKFPVGNIQRLLSIKATIRFKKQKNSRAYVYGVEFNEGEEDDRLVLFGFIFNAMAFGNVQKIR